MKFAEYVEKWKTLARLNVGPGWRIAQDKMLEIHVLPYLHSIDVQRVTPQHVSEVINQSRLRNHAPRTTKQIYLLLSKIFNDAVSFFECIPSSPIRKKYHCPRIPKTEQPFLRIIEREKLLEISKGHWAETAIKIQIHLGPRISEIISLKWKHIDFKRNKILIHSCYNRRTKTIQPYPKGRKQLEKPLHGALLKYLLAVKQSKNPLPGDFVCESAGGGMLSYHAYQKTLGILCREARIPRRTSHSLRHGCAVYWQEVGGATDHDIQELMGHESSQSTKTYLHKTPERLDKIAKIAMG